MIRKKHFIINKYLLFLWNYIKYLKMTLKKLFSYSSVFLLFQITCLAQQTYYVDQQNGNDSYDGLSTTTAFQHFTTAVNLVQPGDTIAVIGTYHNPSYNPSYTYNAPDDAHLWHSENTLYIYNVHGQPNAEITIKAYDSNTKILGDGNTIIRISNCSYLRVEGFNVEGEVERIPLSTSLALQFVYIILDNNLTGTPTQPASSDIHFRNLDEVNDNDGIVEETDVFTDISNLTIKRPSYIDTKGLYATYSDHLTIINNTIHHTPGCGLRAAYSKFVNISGNEVYHCSNRSYAGTHALVVTKTKPINNNGNSIVIEKNLVHHNYNEMFSWSPKKTFINPRIDEGKGISLQRNNESDWINGQGRILVANNICYWNGYSGIHSNNGYRIDFINNTCLMNSYTNTITYANDAQFGQNIGISTQRGNDIRIINNISVVDTDWNGFAISSSNSTNVQVSDNLIFGANGTLAHDPDVNDVNTTEQNPLFVNAPFTYQNETAVYDFHLQNNSPAIDQGDTASYVPADDYYNNQRDNNPDIGAAEFMTSGIDIQQTLETTIYPNPATAMISINNLQQDTSYSIFDVSGKILQKGQTQNGRILLTNLSSGVYIVHIFQQNFKLIKL